MSGCIRWHGNSSSAPISLRTAAAPRQVSHNQICRYIACGAHNLLTNLHVVAVFLGFLGVLFRTDTDRHGAPAVTSSSSSSSDEDDDGSPRQDSGNKPGEGAAHLLPSQPSRHTRLRSVRAGGLDLLRQFDDHEDAGAPTEFVQLGSPWQMVGGGEACRSGDPRKTPVPCPTQLSAYSVAAVEWRCVAWHASLCASWGPHD